MAQSHDARLAELVAELGGDEVRFLFRDLVERALLELIDADGTTSDSFKRARRRPASRNSAAVSRPAYCYHVEVVIEVGVPRRDSSRFEHPHPRSGFDHESVTVLFAFR
jgi:hypothetical protein